MEVSLRGTDNILVILVLYIHLDSFYIFSMNHKFCGKAIIKRLVMSESGEKGIQRQHGSKPSRRNLL